VFFCLYVTTVSSFALDEYENLQRKFHVEQECRDKAVEIASKAVGQNKRLKRQSQLIMTHIEGLNGEGLDLVSVTYYCIKATLFSCLNANGNGMGRIGLTKTNELDQFSQEKQVHLTTRKKLASSEKKLKQLNRVSVMAFEEFNVLQTKFEVETHCRAEAEKMASEAKRADEDLKRKSLILTETANQDERLAKAFEEISKLNKELAEARIEKEEKIEELTEELTLSKDEEYIKGMKVQLDLAQEEVDNLVNQVTEAETRAKEAEQKVTKLQKKFENFKRASLPPTPPPPPAPAPPPPPPPPPPVTVVKKFMNIMGGKKKKGGSLKRGKKPEDPLVNAMKEMMDRINSGKVQLKPIKVSIFSSLLSSMLCEPSHNSVSYETTLKKSSSTENLLDKSPTKTEETCEWTSIKLRKRTDQGVPTRQVSDDFPQTNALFKESPLRKARSYSANDILEAPVKDEATSELRKILQKQKAVAEREMEEKEKKEKTSKETETAAPDPAS
ncbi:hypothetical protein QZH41_012383, partial [Actinostola sp. cb2023]